MRLALEPRVGDAAVPVEREHDLGRLDLQRAAREAPRAQLASDLVVQVELLRGSSAGASRRCAWP